MKKIRVPLAQRAIDFARGPLVFGVWASCAAGVFFLLQRVPPPIEHLGWVPPVNHEVTAPATGRLVQLLARPMQEVRRGQIVGQLDPRPLEARIETARARIAELEESLKDEQLVAEARNRAAAEDTRQTLESEVLRWQGEQRRYVIDETNLGLAAAELEVDQASDRVELGLFDVQLERARQLAADEVGPLSDVQDLEIQRAQLDERIVRREAEIERTRQELAAATLRRESFDQLRPEAPGTVEIPPALAAIQASIRREELAIAELQFELEGLTLVSPATGQVTGLLASEGQTVLSGRPVLTLMASTANDAVVYLTGDTALEASEGRSVVLTTIGASPRQIETRIQAMGVGIEALPEVLWPQPDIPVYGRPAQVSLGEDALLPGEVFSATLAPLAR